MTTLLDRIGYWFKSKNHFLKKMNRFTNPTEKGWFVQQIPGFYKFTSHCIGGIQIFWRLKSSQKDLLNWIIQNCLIKALGLTYVLCHIMFQPNIQTALNASCVTLDFLLIADSTILISICQDDLPSVIEGITSQLMGQ